MTKQLLILASSSPQRLNLLKLIGVAPDRIIPADINETPLKKELPKDFVLRMSKEKALEYIKDNSYFWNTGIFLFSAKTMLNELKALAKDIYEVSQEISCDFDFVCWFCFVCLFFLMHSFIPSWISLLRQSPVCFGFQVCFSSSEYMTPLVNFPSGGLSRAVQMDTTFYCWFFCVFRQVFLYLYLNSILLCLCCVFLKPASLYP